MVLVKLYHNQTHSKRVQIDEISGTAEIIQEVRFPLNKADIDALVHFIEQVRTGSKKSQSSQYGNLELFSEDRDGTIYIVLKRQNQRMMLSIQLALQLRDIFNQQNITANSELCI